MANNAWERIIKFKADARDLKNAVNLVTKDLKKIDNFVGKINKSFDAQAKKVAFVNKQLDKSTKNLQRAELAARKLATTLDKAGKSANSLANRLLNVFKKLSGGAAGNLGLGKLIGEVGLLDGALRSISGKGLPYFSNRIKEATLALVPFAQAHAAAILAVGGGAAILIRGSQAFYNLGKSARQAVVSINELRAAFSKGGFSALFPAGSILGGNKSKDDIKRAVEEQKKLAKEAEKAAFQYKKAATGLTKLRQQLAKSKRIQDQLLAGSSRYLNIQKNTLRIEKEIAKEEKKREGILKRLTSLDRAKSFLMKQVGGPIGIAKGVGAGVLGGAGIAGADQGIKALSGLLGKQVGLWKASQIAASGFWKALQAIRTATGTAIGALDTYGRALAALIAEHQRGIQVVGGFSAGLFAVGKAAPGIYNLGKGFRQLVEDIAIANEKLRTGGWQNLFPRGSILGGGLIADKNQLQQMSKAIKAEAIKRSQPDITSIGGLKARNTELERTRKIQENIDKFTTGWFQSVRQLGRAQVAYNRTLAESTLLQRALTLDIFAAQNAVKGMAGLLRGAGGLLKGGLKGLGGLLDRPIGRAAEGLAITKELEWLGKNIPFVTQKWRDQIAVVTKWAEGAVVGITSVRLAYAGLNKVLGAVGWADQSARQFVNWERQAARSFHNVAKAANDLSKDVFRALSGVENKFSWFKGPGSKGKRGIFGDVRGGTAKGGAFGDIWNPVTETETGTRGLAGMEAALRKQVELRNNTLATSEKYTAVQARILRIEEAITKEMARRGAIEEQMTQKKALGRLSTAVDNVIATVPKRIAAEKAYEVQKLNSARAVEEELFQQRLAANEKVAADRLQKEKETNQKFMNDWDRRLRKSQDRKQANQRMRENLMLGAGFPLLFGGGVGAVGGGVLGAGLQARAAAKGGGAGGFGAQILLSALGTQIDQFVRKIGELGKAFNEFNPNINRLVESMGISGTALERQIKAYGEVASSEEKLAVATEQMRRILGEDGVKALKDYGQASTEWSNDLARAMLKVQSAAAGFLLWITNWSPGKNDGGLWGRATQTIKAGTDPEINRLKERERQVFRDPVEKWAAVHGADHKLGPKGAELAIIKDLIKERQKQLDIENALGLVTATVNERIDSRLKNLQEERTILENTLKLGTKEAGIQSQIAQIVKEVKGDQESITETQRQRIENEVRENVKLKETVDLYKEIQSAIKDGIVTAIEDAITGAKNLREAFSGLLSTLGSMILRKGLSAGLDATGWFGAAEGAYVKGGFKAFQQGGVVNEPTLGLVGEGGEAEYIIPESKMDDAMARYAGGARGGDVLAGGGEVGGEGGAGGASSGVIDVTFNTQVINDVSYVSYAEFQQGVTAAAQQGAKLGEQATLKKLQTSPSVRRRVGV